MVNFMLCIFYHSKNHNSIRHTHTHVHTHTHTHTHTKTGGCNLKKQKSASETRISPCVFSITKKELDLVWTPLGDKRVPSGHCGIRRCRQVAWGVGGNAPLQPGKLRELGNLGASPEFFL